MTSIVLNLALVNSFVRANLQVPSLVFPRNFSSEVGGVLSRWRLPARGEDRFGKSFFVKSTSEDFSSNVLTEEIKNEILELAWLEDPIHQVRVSCKDSTLTVVVDGDLEDEVTAKHFLGVSFRLVDRFRG